MIKRLLVLMVALALSCAVSAGLMPTDTTQADHLETLSPQSQLMAALEIIEESALAEPCEFQAGMEGLLLAQGCCRVCRSGKACGDSCISRNYTCRKPPGCACNG